MIENPTTTPPPPHAAMSTNSPPEPQKQKPPQNLHHHLITFDKKLSYLIHKLFHPYLPSSLHLILELSADFRFSFPLCLAIFLSPLSPHFLPFLSPLLFGLLLDLCLIGLLKVTFRRSRPPYNPHMSAAVSADNYSFPSGHASRVFFVASLVVFCKVVFSTALNARGLLIGKESQVVEMVVIGVIVWAVLTAISRVLLGRHFLFDVLAGALVGVFEGFIAFRFLRFEEFLSLFIYQNVGQGILHLFGSHLVCNASSISSAYHYVRSLMQILQGD